MSAIDNFLSIYYYTYKFAMNIQQQIKERQISVKRNKNKRTQFIISLKIWKLFIIINYKWHRCYKRKQIIF